MFCMPCSPFNQKSALISLFNRQIAMISPFNRQIALIRPFKQIALISLFDKQIALISPFYIGKLYSATNSIKIEMICPLNNHCIVPY